LNGNKENTDAQYPDFFETIQYNLNKEDAMKRLFFLALAVMMMAGFVIGCEPPGEEPMQQDNGGFEQPQDPGGGDDQAF